MKPVESEGGGDCWRFEKAFLAAFFAAFSLLALLFPYSGDDWAWGSSLGVERLHAGFVNYNGRYSGNLAILALTRMGPLGRITVAATIVLTCFLILDIARSRTALGYLLVSSLMLLMPLAMWRESIVWISGFSNYVLAGVAMLVFLRIALRDFAKGEPARRGLGTLALMTIFGFIASMFMEHVTLYLVFSAGVFIAAYRLRYGRFPRSGGAWAAGFVSGAILMFSNVSYHRALAPGRPNYDSVQTGHSPSALAHLASRLMGPIAGQAVTHNIALNIIVVLALCILVFSQSDHLASNGARRKLVFALAAMSALTAVAYAAVALALHRLPSADVNSLLGVSAIFLLAAIATAALTIVQNQRDREVLLVAAASVIVISVPLVFVNPVGPRCFYPAYILMLIVACVLVKQAARTVRPDVVRYSAWVLGLLLVGALGVNVFIYGDISSAAAQRLATIRADVRMHDSRAVVPALPFSDYVHYGNPFKRPWTMRYKLFYRLPNNLSIVRQKRWRY